VFAELGHDRRLDVWVFPALGLLQALVYRPVPQTVESFGLVEVEVVGADSVLKAQERLDAIQLRNWVGDEPVTVDYEQLVPGEHVQPPVNVVMVSGHGHRPIVGVDRAVRFHRQLLERPTATVR